MIARDIRELVRDQLLTDTTQWNLGTFGAIAEFMRDPGEPVALIDEPGRLAAVTDRGGIGFGDLGQARPFASETAVGQSWSHRVALCLAVEACAMNRWTVLTELGPDRESLRTEDRDGILFDMGLGALQVDICIRATDPGLIATLRSVVGKSLFEADNPAMGAILATGPHRVFIARAGRCEVYQPIPPADGKSPEGPHTHVLPKLLAAGRTHAATEPMPDGLVPFAYFVPAHPLKDGMGRARAWDEEAHRQFQDLLVNYGDESLTDLKSRFVAWVQDGKEPDAFPVPTDKFARHALKVALCQFGMNGQRAGMLRAAIGFENAADDGDAYGHS